MMRRHFFDHVEFVPRGDCNIAAAVIGASVVGAGASIYGANTAASAQRDAASSAIAAQQGMFGQAKQALQPFIDAGSGMIPQLQGWNDVSAGSTSPLAQLLKLVTPGASMTNTLEQTPGFGFTRDVGIKATTNALAARGLAGPGGPLSRGIADYTTGLASGTWKDVVASLLSTYQAGNNSMQNLVNTGEGAAASLAGGATTTGGQIGQNLVGMGNATAASNIATGNAINSAAGSVPTALLLQKLLGSSGGGGGAGGLYGPTGNPWVNGGLQLQS